MEYKALRFLFGGAEGKDPLSREQDDAEKLTRLMRKIRAWGELTWSLCRKTPEEIRTGRLVLSVDERRMR